MARYAAAHRDALLLYKKQYAERNKEVIRHKQHAKYIKNAEKIRAATRRWEKANPEKVNASKRKWEKNNPGICNEKTARRFAAKRRATPKWANQFLMEEVYDLAVRRTKTTGFKWNVDHIVPLNSSVVCGLHVENNLQVIPKVVNCSKSNRYWPDMPMQGAY